MHCLMMLGVMELIFHLSNFLTSEGRGATARTSRQNNLLIDQHFISGIGINRIVPKECTLTSRSYCTFLSFYSEVDCLRPMCEQAGHQWRLHGALILNCGYPVVVFSNRRCFGWWLRHSHHTLPATSRGTCWAAAHSDPGAGGPHPALCSWSSGARSWAPCVLRCGVIAIIGKSWEIVVLS